MKSLSIRNVTKQFGDTHILKGINIDIEPGQFLILVGPSGCGKSTLLNCLAGLEEPTTGQVVLDGRDLIGVSPKDRDIAMVFQSYALYPNMNVRDNIAFGLQMRKVPAAEQASTIDRVAKMLQIEHLLERKPGQLSGGQRQRVAMGRALARKPGLFLFDEPLSNLDAKLRVEMRAEIKLLHQRTQTTSVYVTHDQIEAMTLGDRIAVMKDGVVQQFGSPQDIYERPANLFVAGFIGSPAMNLVPVTPQADGPHVSIRLHSTRDHRHLPVANGALRVHVGRELLMGLRPEAISMDGTAGLPAEVLIVEPTGPDTHVYLQINGKACVGRAAPAQAPRPGAVVEVQVDLSAAVYFDPVSGERVA
jgi:multiple sugar transport system ATP-binding protein